MDLGGFPSPKTGEHAFFVYVRVAVNSMGPRIEVHTTSKRIQAMWFRQYGVRQCALDISHRILRQGCESDEGDMAVAFGDASFVERSIPRPGKGYPAGTSEEGWNWDRTWCSRCRLTSTLCSNYHEVLEPRFERSRPSIHAEYRCRTTSCVRLWHRDVNGCRSILHVVTVPTRTRTRDGAFRTFSPMYENSHERRRPGNFPRSFQQDKARSRRKRV